MVEEKECSFDFYLTWLTVGKSIANCRCTHTLTLTLFISVGFTTMAEPSWQEQIRLRLAERNVKQNAFASIIEQCTNFIYFPRLLHTHPIRPQASTADQAPQGAQCLPPQGSGFSPRQSIQLNGIYTRNRVRRRVCHPSLTSFTILHPRPCRNPVRAAYMASLESQISSLRDELASVYKTQGQNAQRLLAMNETLREKEELSRIESENLRKAREEIDRLRRKVDQHNELMMEKDRTAQVST